MQYAEWCLLSESELSQRDIAEVNLSAAVGLPQTLDLDIRGLCKQVDDWASIVGHAVRRRFKRRLAGEASDLTGDQLRLMVMVTVLQRELGVTYNHQFSEGEYDATDSRNLFIHGLLTGHGGTCATMPVLYTAIARRLGWPLKLVKAKEHRFCRWVEGPERSFNIEATARGFVSHPNSYYERRPLPLTPTEIQRGYYLGSLSSTEELAQFIADRGNCWLDHLQVVHAAAAYREATRLAPHAPAYRNHWLITEIIRRALERLKVTPYRSRLIMPAPQNSEEEFMYPRALNYLRRILDNRSAKLADPQTPLFPIPTL